MRDADADVFNNFEQNFISFKNRIIEKPKLIKINIDMVKYMKITVTQSSQKELVSKLTGENISK